MITLQGLRMRTEWMMDQIRQNAVSDTLEKFKKADAEYYKTSCGGDAVTKLIHDLERLGVDPEYIVELDLQIRDENCGKTLGGGEKL